MQELQIEFRLLLDYFRSIYEDSDRRLNRIRYLVAELSNYQNKIKEAEDEKEAEKENFKEQMFVMKENLENHRTEEMKLIQLIDKLKEEIEHLKASTRSMKPKYETFTNRRKVWLRQTTNSGKLGGNEQKYRFVEKSES
ncbi:hypothetical protein CEXT_275431 [Caerostris extrusa]|uniref:Uncharacterized protein n=1 Tax=Caerostris extrusa TaxID=172846 RepID=A0AAV4VSL6_CAEEX|nr:hypothetical protein CEXT_275431 [Caerostris extrusa]